MTQFSMGDIALIGLLKMDFLGLANLTILGRAKEIIYQNHGVDIDLSNIPLDDDKTFTLLSSGETTGVFQYSLDCHSKLRQPPHVLVLIAIAVFLFSLQCERWGSENQINRIVGQTTQQIESITLASSAVASDI